MEFRVNLGPRWPLSSDDLLDARLGKGSFLKINGACSTTLDLSPERGLDWHPPLGGATSSVGRGARGGVAASGLLAAQCQCRVPQQRTASMM